MLPNSAMLFKLTSFLPTACSSLTISILSVNFFLHAIIAWWFLSSSWECWHSPFLLPASASSEPPPLLLPGGTFQNPALPHPLHRAHSLSRPGLPASSLLIVVSVTQFLALSCELCLSKVKSVAWAADGSNITMSRRRDCCLTTWLPACFDSHPALTDRSSDPVHP